MNKVLVVGACVLGCLWTSPALGQPEPKLPREAMARQAFGADAPWFLRNIPFLEIDDEEIQQVFFYRWKLFRAHIREIGTQGTTVTEFLPDVSWARHPYTDLNDSASFHLLEGRWLRDPTTVTNLIDHLYAGGGNDRHFSESIAAATDSVTRVTGDPAPGLRNLVAMQHVFNLWDDHLDRARNLYWVEPIADATEYTIASIDASGAGFTDAPSKEQNHNGFTGGQSYRPSLNAYQYGNALAIARFAELSHQPEVAAEFRGRAEAIRAAVLSQLWNSALQHFVDRYQRSTPTATAGEFIRGRELVGFVPWQFELPPGGGSSPYAIAWVHALKRAELGGSSGLRTVEPTYPRYLAQYRYDQPTGLPECQWNGPSWPFQTSQTLSALANLLDDYPAGAVTSGDYLHLLRQYTRQHFLAPGRLDLEEDYNPDTGGPIVGLPRSHHYNHSTYVDLVLSGLLGVRPRADNMLELAPLIPHEGERPIRFFALQELRYHGHRIGLYFDRDNTRYHLGAGLSVFVDGKRIHGPTPLAHLLLPLTPVRLRVAGARRVDLAVNVGVPGFPSASASSTRSEHGIAEAIDGRMWFFPEIPNGWSPAVDDTAPTYTLDFGRKKTLASVELYFFGGESEGAMFAAPPSYSLEAFTTSGWEAIPGVRRDPKIPLANGENSVHFPPVETSQIRVRFPATNVRLIELKAFGPEAGAATKFIFAR